MTGVVACGDDGGGAYGDDGILLAGMTVSLARGQSFLMVVLG